MQVTYDGQVKTHEDRKDNGADNEISARAISF
jgi:hypothetical protein